VPVARLALVGAAAAAFALTGCGQETVANDNRNAITDRPVTQPTIIRSPSRVSEAPATVPLPGPKGDLATGAPEQATEVDADSDD
jgi:hypothetical protein